MPRKVYCECCDQMVTPAVAKKHREEMVREQYVASLGHDLMDTTNPIPPITTESIFGHTSHSPPAGASMDLDNVAFPPIEPSPLADIGDGISLNNITPPPIGLSPPSSAAGYDFHFPSHQQPIPDDDFIPDIDPDARQGSPEPYDEDLEGLALEEEFQALEDIQYGSLCVLDSYMIKSSPSFVEGNLHDFDIAICKAFAWLIRSGCPSGCFQPSQTASLALSPIHSLQNASSVPVPRSLQELNRYGTTAVSTPTSTTLVTTATWRNAHSATSHALMDVIPMETLTLEGSSYTYLSSHGYVPSDNPFIWLT